MVPTSSPCHRLCWPALWSTGSSTRPELGAPRRYSTPERSETSSATSLRSANRQHSCRSWTAERGIELLTTVTGWEWNGCTGDTGNRIPLDEGAAEKQCKKKKKKKDSQWLINTSEMKGNSLADSTKLHTYILVETKMENRSKKKNTNKRKKSSNIQRDLVNQ